jgi:TetR/AcrR family transcriptional repressor of nem operon
MPTSRTWRNPQGKHFPSDASARRPLPRSREEGIANLERPAEQPTDWKACIGDASAPFCVCALLANELPILPEEVALEIRAYFRFLSGWLTVVFERGVQQKTLVLANAPRVEAEIFMATVHGAMLSARAAAKVLIAGLRVFLPTQATNQ